MYLLRENANELSDCVWTGRFCCIRMGQCRNLCGVAVTRNAVSATMERFAPFARCRPHCPK